MPQATGMMNTFNTPQYAGELFTADTTVTPFLAMAGGLSGGMQTDNNEFPTAVLFDYPTPKQPSISETQSATAPTGTFLTRAQEKNVVQLFHEAVEVTYVRRSNSGKMSGINTANDSPNPASELDWQIARKLQIVARDVEHTFINGTYQLAADDT